MSVDFYARQLVKPLCSTKFIYLDLNKVIIITTMIIDGGDEKHVNLIQNKLIRVKFPPLKDNEAGVSSVSRSSSLSD